MTQAHDDLTALGAVFDHAAVAAPRLRDLLPLYQDLLGGRCVGGGDNDRVGFRSMQLAYGDGSRVELMEPLGDSGFFDTFFAARGGGLHHVTFKVPDIVRAIATLDAAGWLLTGAYLDQPSWREVFVHPKGNFGTLVQLAQPGPGGGEWTETRTTEDILAGRGGNGTGIPSP